MSEKTLSWTPEQKKIIDTRDCDILVSAAAGSGKTAVLVERIIQIITDPQKPVDVDRLLVVTFTNAAAEEMRTRLSNRLNELMRSDPANQNLRRQTELLHHAHISTIHGFCLYVIRNYFTLLNLDPSFRNADDGEIALLKADCMDAVMERYYEAGETDFLDLVDIYSSKSDDAKVVELVEKLYENASSEPDPEQTLLSWKEKLDDETWIEDLFTLVLRKLEAIGGILQSAIDFCENYGPEAYIETLQSDIEMIEDLCTAPDYAALCLKAQLYKKDNSKGELEFDWVKLASVRKTSPGYEYREIVKNLRKNAKDSAKKLLSSGLIQKDPDIVSRQNASVNGILNSLIDLTLDFAREFSAAKRERNIIDFSDMEHMAVKILIDHDGPTAAADELADHFYEIMVDEYQDSNKLQETILEAVSGHRMGRHNVFCVGDVKQSIYSFRKAKPELFMNKFDRFNTECGPELRIDLHNNFRSNEDVIYTVNSLFEKIMHKEVGGVEYNLDHRLNLGRTDSSGPGSKKSELWLVEAGEDSAKSGIELEAEAIASRIKMMCQPEIETGKPPFKYSDITILLRSMKEKADIYAEALRKEGIPAAVSTTTGYFDAPEIKTILELLNLVDNTLQDISAAAVMHSMIGGFSSDDMAKIMVFANSGNLTGPKKCLWNALVQYAEEASDELSERAGRFISMIKKLRADSRVLNVTELLDEALEVTEWKLIMAARPGGEAALRNIDMLRAYAAQFEKTSYAGLFDFVRYIENVQKYEIDLIETAQTGDLSNAVTIGTIHKSKGLQYKVCIIANADKAFNDNDLKASVLVDPELGPAADVKDKKTHLIEKSLRKLFVRMKLKEQNRGEELRVLYVAMTRAEEKCIISGVARAGTKKTTIEKWKEKHETYGESGIKTIDASSVEEMNSYLDWAGYAMFIDRNMFELHDIYESELKELKTVGKLEDALTLSVLEDENNWQISDERKAVLDEAFEYVYPYEKAQNLKRKYSVSDLKHQSMIDEEAVPFQAFAGGDESDLNSAETKAEKAVSGSDRGTAVHKVFELLDLTIPADMKHVKSFIGELVSLKKMSEEAADMVKPFYITDFLADDISRRMLAAERKGHLKRESRFTIELPADMVSSDAPEGETVIVQGVIDACFLEDGEWVLLDYKTDYVPDEDGEKILTGRYHSQLEYYARALEQITDIKVKQKIIWSCKLAKCIELD